MYSCLFTHIQNIVYSTGRDLLDRHPLPDHIHVTSLLLSSGYFWIGTSVGLTLIYRIPLIEGVPLITAKPYLAMDGHRGQVCYIQYVVFGSLLSICVLLINYTNYNYV